MSKQVAFILLDKDGEVVRTFTKPSEVDHYRFVLEEDGKTYKAVKDLKHFDGRIATIYEEETDESST